MKKLSFIMMAFLTIGMSLTSCKKKEQEISPNSGTMSLRTLSYAYTIKPTDYEVDGSKLNIAPGSIVCIQSGTRGPLYLKNFVGTETNPITFINGSTGQVVVQGTTGPWAIKVGYCKNIRITGTGSNDKYGIVAEGGNNSFVLPELTTDFKVDHVEVRNSGFAGIMAKTDPSCDSSTWRGNFTMRNVELHDNYVHDTKGEGFYVGNSFYNGKTESCGTVYPHTIEGIRVYNNVTYNTGCEGIQVGCAYKDCQIYNNSVEKFGSDPFSAHQNNGIQIGAGTSGTCYNNVVKNGPGIGIIMNGIGGNVVYNNLVISPGDLGIFCDERTEPKDGFSFVNNTIINPGSDGIKLYSEQVPYNNVINNIIVNPATGKYINTNGMPVKVTDQGNYFTADINAAKFKDVAGGVYTLLAGSPAIDKGVDAHSFGVTGDMAGTPRPSGQGYDVGAYEFVAPVIATAKIDGITLLNADNGKDVAALTNNYEINLAAIGTPRINFRADASTDTKSIVFNLNGTDVRTENGPPFSMAGETAALTYNFWTAAPGQYTLKATPYNDVDGKGTAGTAVSLTFTVINSPAAAAPNPYLAVSRLTLVNADTDKDVTTLTNGSVISLSSLGTSRINFRAEISPAVKSVVFTLDNIFYKLEGSAPYAFAGDNSAGNYYAWSPKPGTYTIGSTPYPVYNATGVPGPANTITFTVVN